MDLAPLLCTRKEIRAFAQEARKLGVQYIGLCCGNSSNLIREIASAYERKPPAMDFAPTLENSFVVGDISQLPERAKKIRTHMSGWK